MQPQLLIPFALLLCSCIQPRGISTMAHTSPPRATESPSTASNQDYQRPDPLPVTVTNGEFKFGSGRALDYSLFQPAHRRTGVLVVVGHGCRRTNKEWGIILNRTGWRHDIIGFGHRPHRPMVPWSKSLAGSFEFAVAACPVSRLTSSAHDTRRTHRQNPQG
jgi:hypothetical protein